GTPPIRSILLLAGVVSLVGAPYTVLMPVFATDVLHGDAHTLGFLMGAIGIGALVGAVGLAVRTSVRGLGAHITAAVATLGGGLVAFGLSRDLRLSLLVLLACGWGLMVHMAACNTILQTILDDDKRGRVMRFYAVAVMGPLPLGSLLAGALASRIGAPATVAVQGATCLLAAAAFARSLPALRAQIRPIYARLGIIPAVAAGLATATEPMAAGAPAVAEGAAAGIDGAADPAGAAAARRNAEG